MCAAGTIARAVQPPVHDVTDASVLRSWLNSPLSVSLDTDIFKVGALCIDTMMLLSRCFRVGALTANSYPFGGRRSPNVCHTALVLCNARALCTTSPYYCLLLTALMCAEYCALCGQFALSQDCCVTARVQVERVILKVGEVWAGRRPTS